MKKILTFLLKYWNKSVSEWVLSNYPFRVTTRVKRFKTVFVKKGKIREWRTFTENGIRVYPVLK